MISQSVLSTEYVVVPVEATVAGTPHNPTADPVQFAFMTAGNPGNGDWHTGLWETAGTNQWQAKVLVGPTGGVTLPVGVYEIWLKVTDNPEVPVLQVGTLEIT